MSAAREMFAAITTGEAAPTEPSQPESARPAREMFADLAGGREQPPAAEPNAPRAPAPNPAQGASGRAQPIAPTPVEMFVDIIKMTTRRPPSAM